MRMRWLVALERAQLSALSLPLVPWLRTGQAPGLTVLPLLSDWLQAHILLLVVGITPRPRTPPPPEVLCRSCAQATARYTLGHGGTF